MAVSAARFSLDCLAVQKRISLCALFAFVYSLSPGQPVAPLKPVEHKLQFLCSVQAPYGEWNPLAQFISGINSSAYPLPPDQKAVWTRHAELATAGWENAHGRYLNPIENWRDRTFPKNGSSELAFYPFSGPDAANVFAFFPDARRYLLFGLEPVGCIPAGLSDYNAGYFSTLRRSLDAILTVNFFRTNDMEVDFSSGNLGGVLPALLFMISRSGFNVVDVTRVTITSAGTVERSDSEVPGETHGVAIRFTSGHQKPRELDYFALNLQDYRLRRKPGVMKYLASLPEADTLIKSASYLLHTPHFSVVRDTILSKSRTIIEDDSGIPFRFFDASAWDVRLYGTYTEPIHLFSHWRQDDLELAFASNQDVRPLGFAIGYRHIKLESGVKTMAGMCLGPC
jgi:hypothetical protein